MSLTLQYIRNKVLWPLVSKFVRLSESDENGIGQCVTCGRRMHWKKLQAGHFNPGRFNSIIFEIRGIHSQCYQCNVGFKGRPREYDAYMRKRYGDAVVDELDALAKKVIQFDAPMLLEMIGVYRIKVKELELSKHEQIS